MPAPTPYLLLPGTAREALTHYQRVFGGTLALSTFAELGREDGPAEAVAHGVLEGPVKLFAADAGTGEAAYSAQGLMHALLGAADAETLTAWFAGLAEGGTIVDDLQARPWGAHDGQVRDRFGVLWLIGYEG
jgi:PhnB protein